MEKIARLCVYCGSSNGADPRYHDAARELGAELAARAYARAQPHMPGVQVLGPAPAPLAVLRGRHRRRFLLRTKRNVNIQAVLRQWLAKVKVPASVRVQVDVDPYSFV